VNDQYNSSLQAETPPQSPVIPTTTPVPTVTTTKSNSSILLLITFLFLISVGVLAFFMHQNWQLSNKVNFLEATVLQQNQDAQTEPVQLSASPTITTLISETTSDETIPTFVSSGSQLSLSYQTNWLVTESADGSGIHMISIYSPEKASTLEVNPLSQPTWSIRLYKTAAELPQNSDDQLTFTEWVQADQAGAESYGFETDMTPYTLHSAKGYQGISNGMIYGNLMYMVEINGRVYEITGDKAEMTDIEMNVLNSIKFD